MQTHRSSPTLTTMRLLELKIPPVALGIMLGVLIWVAGWIPTLGFTLPAAGLIAIGLGAAGVIIAIAGVVSFHRARTTVNPLHPESASTLVATGIYRLTRNPMYLGMLLILLGWAVFVGNAFALVIALAFVPLMNRLQIAPEERALTAAFGPAFTAYQSAVRRWL
jgi:protein-S-isoprenylcysteine O-methyltransferase Ste14